MMRRKPVLALSLTAAAAFALAACSSSDRSIEGFPGGEAPTRKPDAPPFVGDPIEAPPVVDRYRELLVTDRAILGGARIDATRNDAPWSFRHAVEGLAPPNEGAAFVSAWLATWQSTSTGPATGSLPLSARPDVRTSLVCPWLRLTPENACDATCSACTAENLDLTRAPFRLLAIVNRLDLAEGQQSCDENKSEARLVFVALDAKGAALPFNVIFEYGAVATVAGDAKAWHALASLEGEPYAAALERISRSVTDRGRTTLKQLRTSENLGAARGTAYELRQFERGGDRLVGAALTNTARDSLNGTQQLADHVLDHDREIAAGDNAITFAMRTASSTMPRADFRWIDPSGIDPSRGGRLDLFGLSTCNGCHAGHRGDTTVLPFSHIGANAQGDTVISKFLDDPQSRGNDELAFRERSLGRRLVGACGSSESSYGGRFGSAGGGLERSGGGPKRIH